MMRDKSRRLDVESFLRASMSARAQSAITPDLWPGVRRKMSVSRQGNWLSARATRLHAQQWLAPAGIVVFALVAMTAWVMLINDAADNATPEDSPVQPANGTQVSGAESLSASAEDVFIHSLKSLESAAPFMVESEFTIPVRSLGGRIDLTWLPYSSGSLFWQMYPDAAKGGVPERFGMGDDFEDRNCQTFESGRVCDRVWIASGEALGYSVYYGGSNVGSGIFVSSDLYRTRSRVALDPELKAEISRRAGTPGLVTSIETIREFRQENGMFYTFDGIKDSPSPFAPVAEGQPNEGSLYAFLMSHLTYVHGYQFLEFPERDFVDAGNFLDIERVKPESETDSEGLVHYRASIDDFLGDEGFWDMWISPEDGLPRRIEIEAVSLGQDPDEPLKVTRATLRFSRFGEDIGIFSDMLFLDVP